MGTGLYDRLKRRTKQPSEHHNTEAFLAEFETITSAQIHKNVLQKDTRIISEFDKDLHDAIKALRKEKEWILVPSDKTNKWVPMRVAKYITIMQETLNDECTKIDNKRLSDTYKEAKELLSKFKSIMNDSEYQYIETFLETRRIPMPRLLIKDHKAENEDGTYPTRLLTPATNFTQCFAKLSYKCIKHIFEARGIKIMKRTIVQSSHLKIKLDELNLKRDNCAIASLDIIKMYPSIQNKLIRKAVAYYSRNLSEADKELIDAALEMQEFSMRNTLLMFRDNYYEYGTADNAAEKVLTIGGYDSAWLADLVGSYIFDLAEDQFQLLKFLGLYRDDGNIVFNGIKTTEEIVGWLTNFQTRVNEIVGDDSIQFTMDIWRPGEQSSTLVIPGKVEVVGTDAFPYLDMQMKFDENDMLCFECYSKPGYQRKYLNTSSTHTAANKRSIPRGVSIRLAGESQQELMKIRRRVYQLFTPKYITL